MRRTRHGDVMTTYIREQLTQTRDVIEKLSRDAAVHMAINKVADLCVRALESGNKLLFAGNGGSAADAQHIAGEFVSRFMYDRPGLAAFALTTDTSVITAIGNDYGYEKLFSRQVQAVGKPGDIFFGISTSGRSPNVIAAFVESRQTRTYHGRVLRGQRFPRREIVRSRDQSAVGSDAANPGGPYCNCACPLWAGGMPLFSKMRHLDVSEHQMARLSSNTRETLSHIRRQRFSGVEPAPRPRGRRRPDVDR